MSTCRQLRKRAGGWRRPVPGSTNRRNAPESATAKRRGALALIVKKSFHESDGTYGYRRVHMDLVAWGFRGWLELVLVGGRACSWAWSPVSRSRGGSVLLRVMARSMYTPYWVETGLQPPARLVRRWSATGPIQSFMAGLALSGLMVIDCQTKEVIGRAMVRYQQDAAHRERRSRWLSA